MPSERVRQELSSPVSLNQIQELEKRGWKAVAIEWERPGDATSEEAGSSPEAPPFGLRVGKDCRTLEDHPEEKEILATMMELIIQDGPYSFIAQELNRKGYLTRSGSKWSPVSVFKMLPRLIETGPKIFSSENWSQRRQHYSHR